MNAAPFAIAGLGGGLVAELWPRAPYEVCDGGGPGVVGFAFEAQEGEDAIASDRVRPFRRRANTLAWIPPGCPAFSTSRTGGEYLVLRGLAADAIAHPDAALRAVNDAADPIALATARALRRWLLAGPAHDQAATAMVDVLRAALLARFQGGPGRAAGWLTPARTAVIDRLIATRMDERIETADFATELGLSVGFLVLAFRGALGTTPHHYLMERRLARARAELTSTAKPIAGIALECGFADQAHLTRHMRTALSITPAAYRRLSRA
jgi:AraC family transcriptional regulator